MSDRMEGDVYLVYALLVSGTNLRLGGGGEMRDRMEGDGCDCFGVDVDGSPSVQLCDFTMPPF